MITIVIVIRINIVIGFVIVSRIVIVRLLNVIIMNQRLKRYVVNPCFG